MQITILATGKCKEKPILQLEEKYFKLLKSHFKTSIIELPQAKVQRAEDIKAQEAKQQLDKISDSSYVIALDERGDLLSTRQFAQMLKQVQMDGTKKDMVFVIGGAEGLDESIRKRANKVISLSKLTFPHMMVRPILEEQIYRAASLNAGHPYHRD